VASVLRSTRSARNLAYMKYITELIRKKWRELLVSMPGPRCCQVPAGLHFLAGYPVLFAMDALFEEDATQVEAAIPPLRPDGADAMELDTDTGAAPNA